MSKLSLYFHTVRHLRPLQIAARLKPRFLRPRPGLREAPALRAVKAAYRAPVAGKICLIAPESFRLLNVERSCATAADWHPRDAEKLWVYNLHYFDDLNAEAAQSRSDWHLRLLDRWVAEIPAGYGEAWEPYPVSRRIVNWVKWSLRGGRLSRPTLDSLAAQARWLIHRLEYHLLGNHLFVNGKALFYAGLYYTGAEAEAWRARGLAIIEEQMREQVLPDGGHFELSPMYHAAMLEDVLDLINVQQCYGFEVPREWQAAVGRMRQWLCAMNHPDGEIAFFNDSAFGIAPRRDALEQYANRLDLPAVQCERQGLLMLRDSGYARMGMERAYLVCDCGQVGPSYQPGHAHADTLSFELSLDGRRVFVNSGTARYGADAERHRQRGTAAHNTVVVDDENSSEVWAGFRVARRARTRLLGSGAQDALMLDASHDGYRRLPGRNEHRRRWELREGNLRIEDCIAGPCRSAEAFFHLHPEVQAQLCDASSVVLSWLDSPFARMKFDGAAAVEVEAGTWHPTFGAAVGNQRIRVRFKEASLISYIDWVSVA